MIRIESLSKSYGDHQILNDINLTFNKGEVTGIVGENGAGKTTLFKCIAGFEGFSGTTSYDGGVLKNCTGYLPTDPYFLSKMTGHEYLQLMCNARGLSGIEIKERNVFDLPLKEYAENYSTGMKKKLALTGLLIQKNEVFILDEPFNGVDIQSNILIQQIIVKLKQLQKIVLMSSHIFSTLEQSCDQLHQLKNGTVWKSAGRDEFKSIEEEMKGEGMARKIDLLFA
jgi:ABC-2 type transport system ATP-binding protein